MNLGLVTATHLGRIWLFPNFEPRWSELENRYQPRAKFLEFQCRVENLRSGQLRIAFTVRLHQFYNLARRGFRRQSSQAETPPGRVRSMISTCTTTIRSTRSTMRRGFKRWSLRALTLWGALTPLDWARSTTSMCSATLKIVVSTTSRGFMQQVREP